MFVDECKLVVRAGTGGNGVVAFLREKFRPWGGPAGGDGGKGGDVTFVASRNEDTLLYLARNKKIIAGNGEDGENKQMAGISAKDIFIKVPLGTVVKDAATGKVLFDFTRDEQKEIICKGGQGGFGNSHYATAIHRTPRRAELGQRGEERRLILELKLIADVGLAGLPNAGKSSLLARLSAARPKVADYPFTTLAPMVGVVAAGRSAKAGGGSGGPSEGGSFVMADIPGLIEGAHEGKGLGIQFLKHIERTRLILHVVDLYPPDESNPYENFCKIREELRAYSASLAERPAMIALNKTDLAPDDKAIKKFKKAVAREKPPLPVMAISCISGAGLPELVMALYERVQAGKQPEDSFPAANLPGHRGQSNAAPVEAAVVDKTPVPAPSPASLLIHTPRPDLRRQRVKLPPGTGKKHKLAPFARTGRRNKRKGGFA